jgi:hypothetical protein
MTTWQEQSNCKQYLEEQGWINFNNQFDNETVCGKNLNLLSNSNFYYKIQPKNNFDYVLIAHPVDEFFYLKHGSDGTELPTKYKFGGYIICICIKLYKNSSSYLNTSYYCSSIITSTNRCSYDRGYSHPHIKYKAHSHLEDLGSYSNMCLGNFHNTLVNLAGMCLFQDLFMNFVEYLKQYNEVSPFIKIRYFFNERCSVCGDSVDQSMLLDGVLVCGSCRNVCKKCNNRISRNTSFITELDETGEEIHICKNCFKVCPICGNFYWKYCTCKFHLPISNDLRLDLIKMGIKIPDIIIPLTNEELGIDFSY